MPKPRLSNSRRRKMFFERKYTHQTVPLRVKPQLDRMTNALDWQLTILDELEKQVFADLETKTNGEVPSYPPTLENHASQAVELQETTFPLTITDARLLLVMVFDRNTDFPANYITCKWGGIFGTPLTMIETRSTPAGDLQMYLFKLFLPSVGTKDVYVKLDRRPDRMVIIACGVKDALNVTALSFSSWTDESKDPTSWRTALADSLLIGYCGTWQQPTITLDSGQTQFETNQINAGGPTSKIKAIGCYERATGGLQFMDYTLDLTCKWITMLGEIKEYIPPAPPCQVLRANWPYYMAFAKRAFDKHYHFDQPTADNEVALLIDEFVKRGLKECALIELAAIAKTKGELAKAEEA